MVCSLAKVTTGGERYYTNLARDDYYTKGGEPPGIWLGAGAKALNLVGEIRQGDKRYQNIFYGKHPETETPLRHGGSRPNSVCAWDFTFSASKSISVLWALSDPETRQTISECHKRAVSEAAKYLEDNACYTRVGKGGAEKEQVKPVFAAFQHSTSRELDPQLHTHLLLMNTALRDSGKGGTLDGRDLLRHRYKAQKTYSDTLRKELTQQLKVNTQEVKLRYGSTFEIEGVPKELCSEFSKRRAQISKVLSETDTSHERQAKVLQTRKGKLHHVNRSELFSEWQKVGKEHGFNYKTCINHRKPLHIRDEKSSIIPPCINHRKPLHIRDEKSSIIPPKLRAVINSHVRQFKKERHEHRIKQSNRLKKKITVLYAIGRVDRETYLRITTGKGLPTTKVGIEFQYATYRISRKQRNYLLSKLEQEKRKDQSSSAERSLNQNDTSTRQKERERERER